MNYYLLIIPFISAFIGWFTNWLAIKMLFHPRNTKKLFGLNIQGVLPKHQLGLASRLSKVVSEKLFSFNAIEQKISDPENFKKIAPIIDDHVEDFLRKKLPAEMPMISMFIGDKTINKMKAVFLQEIEQLFPKVMQQFAGNLKTELDLEHIIYEKISSFSTEELEQTLYKTMSRELRQFRLAMTAIGFVIGVFELILLIVTN